MKKISEYGIFSDSSKILTDKIQYAIDDAAKEGKTLVFEKGIYKTRIFMLK